MPESILITGGTGLVGLGLQNMLKNEGYEVRLLSRKADKAKNQYYWNLEAMEIDEEAVLQSNYVIHLAGSNVGDSKWTDSKKRAILDSRTKSQELILNVLKKHNHKLKGYISASGSGFYGFDTGNTLCNETMPSGSDFLAKVCVAWEQAAHPFAPYAEFLFIGRIGVVLAKKGGALEKMAAPMRIGIASPLGSGNQYLSWIHLDDLCHAFVYALKNKINGTYNLVADEAVTNCEFTKILSKFYGIPFLLPAVPSFVLKIMLGEMANIVLGGNKVSNHKFVESGYQFKYKTLKIALEDLYK